MKPIILPLHGDKQWESAYEIVTALRAHEKSNPWIVAAVVSSYAESRWQVKVDGDNDQSHGLWQIKNWQAIFDGTRIDIRTEDSRARHVEALLWLLYEYKVGGSKPYAHATQALDAAKDSSAATAIFTTEIERCGAAGALQRRVAIAPLVSARIALMPR